MSNNAYGLFQEMPRERPEIVLEGSDDGRTWKTYTFRYKPTDVDRRPTFVGPHMPRLDWQMWFAALEDCSYAYWFPSFLNRLLTGEESVRALLEDDPFSAKPPRYLRTTRYLYSWTDLHAPGWWRREKIGPYCPTATLVNGGHRG